MAATSRSANGRTPGRYVRRHAEKIVALRHDGTVASVADIENAWPGRFIEWSGTDGQIHLAEESAGDDPPLLAPGDWLVDIAGEVHFVDDDEFRENFGPATVEVRSDLLDALVEAVSTRSSETDPAVVRAAQDLAVASLRRP
jgi:hypothetical protein